MAAILSEAVKPKLKKTLEHTPVLVHAGPFGNIAHGNSSVLADLIGIDSGEFLVTEAGFGADMGAERFFNIKCRASGLVPDAAVVVATVRALRLYSGRYRIVAGRPLPPELLAENPDDVLARSIQRPGEAAHREHPLHRGDAGGRRQRLRVRPPLGVAGRSRRSRRAVPGCASPRAGWVGWPKAGRKPPSSPRPLPRSAAEPGQFRLLYPDY